MSSRRLHRARTGAAPLREPQPAQRAPTGLVRGLHGPLGAGDLLALQRAIGNRAVLRLGDRRRGPAVAGAAGPLIQRKLIRVKKGEPTASSWTLVRTEGDYEIYDDGQPSTENDHLEPTRWAINDLDDDLSEAELSDTELDRSAKSGVKKIYHIDNIRDVRKVVKQMRAAPTSGIGVRLKGSDSVFRLEGRTTQFFVKTVAKNALKQKNGTMASGAMPARGKADPKPTGDRASYEHVVTELKHYKDAEVAQALWDRYFDSKPYPSTFSARAKAKMDEIFTILALAEPFRTDYAFALLVAAIEAIKNGTPIKDVLYKGTGQLEALHVGASSHKKSKVSGQLMEQNVGRGRNNPHPTQKGMNISDAEFRRGTKRTYELFQKAAKSQEVGEFVREKLDRPVRSFKKRKTQATTTSTTTTSTTPPTTTPMSGVVPTPPVTSPGSSQPLTFTFGPTTASQGLGSPFAPPPTSQALNSGFTFGPLPPTTSQALSNPFTPPTTSQALSNPFAFGPPSTAPVLPSSVTPPALSTAVITIDMDVAKIQKPRKGWNARVVVVLKHNAAALRVGQQVQLRGVRYTVQNITPKGFVLLR